MKRTRKRAVDKLRPEYKRSDFGVLIRGKYVERLREMSNVVVLVPKGSGPVPLPEGQDGE